LLPNEGGRFVCKWTYLRVSKKASIYTEGLEGAIIRLPIAHGAGRYKISKAKMKKLNAGNLIPIRYCDTDGSLTEEANPDGSIENIAGVLNEERNVLGMMPYPERASRPLLSSTDGLAILRNFVEATKSS
jgi:phosphoribosylformylglycinamidine synthase